MSTLNGFEAYKIFMGLKTHFISPSYDYFKYGGVTKVTIETFQVHRNKFHFMKLAKKYKAEEFKMLVLANLLHNKNIWVGDLLTPEAHTRFKEYQKRMESLTYIFATELDKIFEVYPNPDDALSIKNGQVPGLLGLYSSGEISIQTLGILSIILGFLDPMNRKLKNNLIWDEIYSKINKYRPFLSINRQKYEEIVKEKTRLMANEKS